MKETFLFGLTRARMNYVSFAHAISFLQGDCGKTQRKLIDKVFKDLQNGVKGLNGADLVEQGILGDREICMVREEIENIPKDGPLVIISNHDKNTFGTVYSVGQVSAINYVVEWARQGAEGLLDPNRDKEKTTPHWMQAATSRNALGKITSDVIHKRVGEAFGHILVDRKGQKNYQWSVRQALGILRRGGVIGIMPEGDTSFSLRKIDPDAEDLLKFIAKHPVIQVVPIAALMGATEIGVRVGQPIRLDRINPGMQVMTALAHLLPPRKRGYYA